MDVKDAIEQIRLYPGALVDCSFGQGRDVFLEQLEERTGRNEAYSVDNYIEDCRDTIAGLIQRVAPYEVPKDYIFFLEYYGGIFIEGDNHTLSILGTGPNVEEWYSSVESDDALLEVGRQGFLKLGSLNFARNEENNSQRIAYFLDLAGNVQKHCVIGVGPWGKETLTPIDILKNIHAYHEMWKKVANSFTAWLEQAAITKGGFGYT